MEICQQIKDAGYTPIAASFAEIPHYWFEFCIYNYLTPATHNIVPGAVDDEHGKAWVDGIADMKLLYENGFLPENTLSATDGETFQLFIDGKAAFLIDGSWKVGGIEGATGMTSAVQDQVTQEQRVPVFNGMPDIVTGKKDIAEAVQELLDLVAADQQ